MGSDGPEGDDADDDAVVRPEELDFTRDERVAVLREDRFVVSTDRDGRPPDPSADPGADEPVPGIDPDGGGGDEAGTEGDATPDPRERLRKVVAGREALHGFSITVSVDDETAQHEAFSDDLGSVFGELLTWYATQVDEDTPPEEVLGILLMAADRPVAFPREVLVDLLQSRGFGPDDRIGDLVASLDGGLRLPEE